MELEPFKPSLKSDPNGKLDSLNEAEPSKDQSLISFYAELPCPLQRAMTTFIEKHPCWDQYRLIQAALAGFLVQNGVDSRSITRLYVGNMFSNNDFIQGL